MDAQKAQIRTAGVAIGIEPKSARNGGSARGYGGRIDHALATSAIKVPGRAGRLALGILL
jgi:hypothetical protein